MRIKSRGMILGGVNERHVPPDQLVQHLVDKAIAFLGPSGVTKFYTAPSLGDNGEALAREGAHGRQCFSCDIG